MKKIILGIFTTLAAAALATVVWSVLLCPGFELEGATRDRLNSAVSWASLGTLLVYLGCVVYYCCAARDDLDGNSYQPLCTPYPFLINACVQVLAMWLGFPGSLNGDSILAFACAMVFALVVCFLALVIALIIGRPIPGTSVLPFTTHSRK